ncbi:MAG: hypothetical protein JWO30_4213 [Fibrobacteres bacterium]|nr:hypothetical protein [Fibrobacterota bacterium]
MKSGFRISLALGALMSAVLLTAHPAPAMSAPGDVVGKVTVGYQGWFAAKGDGSPFNGWWHQAPSPSGQGIKDWPDTREYTKLYATTYQNLGNGQPAKLFSSFDQSTVDVHFKWMKEYGIDCAALQRFNPTGGEGPVRDSVTRRVRNAAEKYGVKFYIMYDVTGWTNMQTQMKTDWTNKMSAYTSSPMYAKQNGKPVVDIWGLGFNDGAHPFTNAQGTDVIAWFKSQGCYVIGGVPRDWRTSTAFASMHHSFDMISPWLIGSIGSVSSSNSTYTNYFVPDEADCKAHNIDYQPCVLPGDNSVRQRVHGDLMWRMFYNEIKAGAQAIYISMYDEYNEGNQIAKTAENASMLPVGSNFRGLDEDGTICSSDYYLRIAGDGGKMLKGIMPLTEIRPTVPNAPLIASIQGPMDPAASGDGTVLRFGSRGSASLAMLSLPVKTTALSIYDNGGRLVAQVPVVNNGAVWSGAHASGMMASRGGYVVRATDGKHAVARTFVLQ